MSQSSYKKKSNLNTSTKFDLKKNKIQNLFDSISIGMDEQEVLAIFGRKADKILGSGIIHDIYLFENNTVVIIIWLNGYVESKELYLNDMAMVKMINN